jgi:hypothetical protein
MVLRWSWVRSGRPARRSRWSNQGTAPTPRMASAHHAHAATPGHQRRRADRAAGVTVMVVGACGPPVSGYRQSLVGSRSVCPPIRLGSVTGTSAGARVPEDDRRRSARIMGRHGWSDVAAGAGQRRSAAGPAGLAPHARVRDGARPRQPDRRAEHGFRLAAPLQREPRRDHRAGRLVPGVRQPLPLGVVRSAARVRLPQPARSLRAPARPLVRAGPPAVDGPVWVRSEERPTVEEALRRLRYLHAHGPSPRAFTLRRRFEPDGRPSRPSRGPRPGARAGSREPGGSDPIAGPRRGR